MGDEQSETPPFVFFKISNARSQRSVLIWLGVKEARAEIQSFGKKSEARPHSMYFTKNQRLDHSVRSSLMIIVGAKIQNLVNSSFTISLFCSTRNY